jgi:hypothetical protein
MLAAQIGRLHPASCSFRIAMICSSVCRFRLIVWSLPQGQTPVHLGSIQGGNVKRDSRCFDGPSRWMTGAAAVDTLWTSTTPAQRLTFKGRQNLYRWYRLFTTGRQSLSISLLNSCNPLPTRSCASASSSLLTKMSARRCAKLSSSSSSSAFPLSLPPTSMVAIAPSIPAESHTVLTAL